MRAAGKLAKETQAAKAFADESRAAGVHWSKATPYRMPRATTPGYQPSAYAKAMKTEMPQAEVVTDQAASQTSTMPGNELQSLIAELKANLGRTPQKAMPTAPTMPVSRPPLTSTNAGPTWTPKAYPTPTPGPVTKVPMGVSGNEFAGVQPYGPSTDLTAEELAASPEFWDMIASLSRGQ